MDTEEISLHKVSVKLLVEFTMVNIFFYKN